MKRRKLKVQLIDPDILRIEISPVNKNDDTVDLLREARDRLMDQVGASEKGKVSLGRILSQKIS